MVRKACGQDFLVVTPGIRSGREAKGDQFTSFTTSCMQRRRIPQARLEISLARRGSSLLDMLRQD